MINYTSSNQLSLEGFEHPFGGHLDSENRWVVLSKVIPWDDLASVYASSLDSRNGRKSVDIRLVIGALIIKHYLGLDDRGTVQMIRENLYLQYFCGMKRFRPEAPFDPSLFVDIRKRMGGERFDRWQELVIERAEQFRPKKKKIMDGDRKDSPGKEPVSNRGTLKVDATVADQQVAFPTDLKLLSACREQTEVMIDDLCKHLELKEKPRTYRRKARALSLSLSKKRKKARKQIRTGIKQQLAFVKRNLKSIDKLLDQCAEKTGNDRFPLDRKTQHMLWVVTEVYRQQQELYDRKSHSTPNRIVNIHQPYVRPIVRGKDKASTEFGAKINVGKCNGFSRIDLLSWEAFNESTNLEEQVERYRQLYGCYPELLLADQIYLTRQNRKMLKQKGIRIVGKALGRPRKVAMTAYQRRKQKKERNQRNDIEGTFGTAKTRYDLNVIKARRADTSESWIHAIFFVMNIQALLKLARARFSVTLLTYGQKVKQSPKIVEMYFCPQWEIAA
jgi:transposase, IS5 family